MVTDWIIIGAIVVLLAGVILAFKIADQDTDPAAPKPLGKAKPKRAPGGR
jgi:hypothetical protein